MGREPGAEDDGLSLGPPQRFVVAAAPCLRVRIPSGAEPAWEFERNGQARQITPLARLICSSIHLMLRAAIDGAAFIPTFEGYAQPHLESGARVEVLADWSESFPGPFLYYSSRRALSPPLRAFVDVVQARRRT